MALGRTDEARQTGEATWSPLKRPCLGVEGVWGKAGGVEGLAVDDGRESTPGGCHAPHHAYGHDHPQHHHLPLRQDSEGAETNVAPK